MNKESEGRHADEDGAPDAEHVSRRADLLPEERAAGVSDDPQAQAEAVLAESVQRTEHPDPDDSTQSVRRSSKEAT